MQLRDGLIDTAVLEALREYQAETGMNLLEQLYALFMEEGPKLLSEMGKAVETGNREDLARSSHTLCSSSRNMGARKMSDLAAQIETQTRQGAPIQSLRPAVAEIERQFPQVGAELQQVIFRKAA